MTRVRGDLVEQVVTGAQRVRLRKEVLELPLPEGGALAMVRKRLPGRRPRAAVLLVHGLALNRHAWHLPQRSFSAYLASRGYDVYNLDLRGHGRSRDLGSPLPRGFEDYVEGDLSVALRAVQATGHRGAYLLGHSLGGAVCYAVAAREAGRRGGSRVRGVVTLSGVYRWGGASFLLGLLTRLLRRLDLLHRRAGLGTNWPLRLDLLGRLLALRPLLLECAPVGLSVEGWVPGSVEEEVVRSWFTGAFDRTSLPVLTLMGRWAREGGLRDGAGRRDYAAGWATCRVPVLVLAASRDRLADPEHDVRPAYEASRAEDRCFRCFGRGPGERPYGHLDLVVGRSAPDEVWPCIADWLDSRSR